MYTYPGVKIDVIALELIYDLVETEVLDLHSIQNMTYQLPLKCLMFMFRNCFIIFVKNNKLAHLEYIFNFIIEINLNFYVASFSEAFRNIVNWSPRNLSFLKKSKPKFSLFLTCQYIEHLSSVTLQTMHSKT